MEHVELKINQLQENMDSWVKDMRSNFEEFSMVPEIVAENIGNTQHNYELIKSLQKEIHEIKQELQLQRLTQILMLQH